MISPVLLMVLALGATTEPTNIRDLDPVIQRGQLQADSARYVVDLRCPDRNTQPACAARASVRVAGWVRSNGVAAEELLVNVDGPDGRTGFQLRGAIPSAAALQRLTVGQVLDRFSWNGGSYGGKDAVARWCMAGGAGSGFCRVFRADSCNPVAPPDTLRYCRQR